MHRLTHGTDGGKTPATETINIIEANKTSSKVNADLVRFIIRINLIKIGTKRPAQFGLVFPDNTTAAFFICNVVFPLCAAHETAPLVA